MAEPRDIEASLADMDRKLRELQRELALVSRREEGGQTPHTNRVNEPGPVLEQATARVEELGRRIDELTRLRHELDEATRALIAENSRPSGGDPAR
jgi:prefoldin subunit 5